MPYQATVIRVMIASPSDASVYRDIVRDVLYKWNDVHSEQTKVVLTPVGWDTHSSPDLSATAQELINERVLKDCDLLIAVFSTRLGSPTLEAMSGTAEEIDRHTGADKPAMVYFSEAPIEREDLKTGQYSALEAYEEELRSKGITQRFKNDTELREKLAKELQINFYNEDYLKSIFRRDISSNTLIEEDRPSADPKAQLASALTEEARTLLVKVAEAEDGRILYVSAMDGTRIVVSGKVLTEPLNRRSVALWEHALEQLVDENLVSPLGHQGSVFAITKLGYELADYFSSEGATSA